MPDLYKTSHRPDLEFHYLKKKNSKAIFVRKVFTSATHWCWRFSLCTPNVSDGWLFTLFPDKLTSFSQHLLDFHTYYHIRVISTRLAIDHLVWSVPEEVEEAFHCEKVNFFHLLYFSPGVKFIFLYFENQSCFAILTCLTKSARRLYFFKKYLWMLKGLVSAVEITKVNTYLLYMEERLECFH